MANVQYIWPPYIPIHKPLLKEITFFVSSPCQRQCELFPSLGVPRPSVNFSHFNLLL